MSHSLNGMTHHRSNWTSRAVSLYRFMSPNRACVWQSRPNLFLCVVAVGD